MEAEGSVKTRYEHQNDRGEGVRSVGFGTCSQGRADILIDWTRCRTGGSERKKGLQENHSFGARTPGKPQSKTMWMPRPLSEVRETEGLRKVGGGVEIKNSVLVMFGLRCLLGIWVPMSNRQLDI